MSKTVLSEVDGFTPLIDAITQEHGVVTAAVFGRMWRYCQGDNGVCQAGLERIGDDLGLDKATVQRHAAKLCDLGYLEDTTPGLRNRPHTYRDTGKAGLAINIHVAQNNVTLHTATSDCTPQRDVAESQLKKELKRQTKKEIKEGEGAGAPPSNEPQTKPVISEQQPAVKVYLESGGKLPTGKLMDGTPKSKRAEGFICEHVRPDPDSLALWARVVDGYQALWSAKSYTIMVNDYYLRGRVPGQASGGTHGITRNSGGGQAAIQQAPAKSEEQRGLDRQLRVERDAKRAARAPT